MNNVRWTWGFAIDDSQWFLKVEEVDTGLYAMAYFSPDDDDPMRRYETQSPRLLQTLIEVEETEIFKKCRDQKNMRLGLKDHFDKMTVANFM